MARPRPLYVYESGTALHVAHSRVEVCEEHGYAPRDVRRCRWDETATLQNESGNHKETLTMREITHRYPAGYYIPEGP